MRSGVKTKEKLGQSQFILIFFAFSFGMILSNLLAQNEVKTEQESIEPLFIYKGIDKTIVDVSPDIKRRLEKLYAEERYLAELAGIELHVHHYANAKGLSVEEASRELFSGLNVENEQINQFYKSHQAEIAKPFYLVKDQIAEQLKFQEIKQAKQNLLHALAESGDLLIIPGR